MQDQELPVVLLDMLKNVKYPGCRVSERGKTVSTVGL